MTQQHLELNDTRPATTASFKPCTQCGLVKPLDAYSPAKAYRDNRSHCCKRCKSLLDQLHTSHYRPTLVRRFYERQRGLCPVCDQPLDLEHAPTLDHPHSLEAMQNVHTLAASVTGLLHRNCNVGLGMLRDDPTVLRRAARYIERTRRYGQQTLDL